MVARRETPNKTAAAIACRCRWIVALAGWLLFGVASSAAQTLGATTGALNGTVTDRTGAVLPGVAVVASSIAMMGSRSTVTDARGRYEVPAVPPGAYTLVFSLPRFRSVRREGIVVNLGGWTTVDQNLDLAGREETTVVTGNSPVVDRTGTSMAFSHDAQQLADLPVSRSSSAIIDATPGVQLTRFDVGGSAGPAGGPFSAYGTSGLNRPTIEGIAITSYNPLGFTLDYGSLEHVAVGLGAHGPEWPWPGVAIQFITKSGGNRHRGSLYLDYEHRAWQAFNIDADQIQRSAQSRPEFRAEEANRLWSYRDANVDAGGPLRKDRLWWYLSLRNQEVSARQVSFPVFPVEPVRARITNLGGKGTARVAGNNRFVLFGQVTRNHQPTRLEGFLRPGASVNTTRDSTSNQTARGGVWKVEWNAYARQSFYFEVLGGQFIAGRHETPNSTLPRLEDITSGNVFGGNRDWKQSQQHDQIVASASYLTTGWAGSHQLKFGGEFRRVMITERWSQGYPDGVLLVTQNSLPSEVYLFQTPSKAVGGLQWYGAHLNDSWRVTSRLTLNLGLRFDRYRVFFPMQEHPPGQLGPRSWPGETFPAVNNVIDWNVVVPRVGASQDLTGDGRTVLKLSYGRYSLPPGFEILLNANSNTSAWWEKSEWKDDGDRQWDVGENVRPLEQSWGDRIESLDPNLKLGSVREVTARLEREIVPNMGVETGVVWRGERQGSLRQNVTQPFGAFTRAVTVTDPGINGVVGPAMVVYDLPERNALPPSYMVRNVPNARSDNLTWEVTARRRFSRRWSLVAGFSHTWAREHANAYFGQVVRANVYPLTPNDLINTGDGGRHEFRVWSFRAYGTYDGPWGLGVKPFLRHQSGQPYGRTFLVPGLNLGSPLWVLAEPIGTRRMDHVTLFDLRVEKTFSLGPGRRVSAFVDVFNLLNANPEQNVNWSSGAFRRPLTIVPPRIARLGVKVHW